MDGSEEAPEASERHLGVKDLAERMGVPEDTVYRWNSRGGGPPYLKIGKIVRYRLADVIRWENERTRSVAS